MTAPEEEPLRPPGLRALRTERQQVRQLRADLTDAETELDDANLRIKELTAERNNLASEVQAIKLAPKYGIPEEMLPLFIGGPDVEGQMKLFVRLLPHQITEGESP